MQYTCEQYRNLSEGKKNEKRQYGCEWNKKPSRRWIVSWVEKIILKRKKKDWLILSLITTDRCIK